MKPCDETEAIKGRKGCHYSVATGASMVSFVSFKTSPSTFFSDGSQTHI